MIFAALRRAIYSHQPARRRICAAILCLWLAPVAPAQVTVTPTAIGDSGAFTVSSTDLLQTNLSAAAITNGSYSFFGTNSLGTLTDGVFGAGGPDYLTSVSFGLATAVRFDFDLTASPAGYNLTEIRTYTGWDTGRDGQEFQVDYSVAASPNTFIALATVGPYDVTSTLSYGRVMVSITDLLGGTLIGNVAALRFTFTAFENGASAWREIDAIGTPASIPEPAHAALLFAVAMVGALVVRRHRGKAQGPA
jgi:hypothetical protein